MVMIQEGPQNTGADKPLRISGEAFKVQVGGPTKMCIRCNLAIPLSSAMLMSPVLTIHVSFSKPKSW